MIDLRKARLVSAYSAASPVIYCREFAVRLLDDEVGNSGGRCDVCLVRASSRPADGMSIVGAGDEDDSIDVAEAERAGWKVIGVLVWFTLALGFVAGLIWFFSKWSVT